MEKAEGFAIPVVQRRKQARERAAGPGSPWSPSHCLDADDVKLLGQTVKVLVILRPAPHVADTQALPWLELGSQCPRLGLCECPPAALKIK